MTDLALYRQYRDKEGLHIVPRNPATGKEKRTKTKSTIPHSHNRSLSENAKLLRNAMRGDTEAEIRIINELTRMVTLRAKSQNWGLRGDLRGLAVIALRKYIYLDELTQQKAADECKTTRRTYVRSWSTDKLDEVRSMVQKIHSELIR